MSREQRLRINEIFHSIQGEGTRTGVPCVFVRLTGCHLRCTYCDTEYAFTEGEWMTVDEVLQRIRSFNCQTVEVTGGEPLLQPAALRLLARLCDEYATVLLETSGTVSIAEVDPRVIRIVDLKCPSSGEGERNELANVPLLTERDEVKFVIGTREDYEWARKILSDHALAARCPVVYQPVTPHPDAANLKLAKGGLSPRQLAEWLLEDGLNVRLGLQLHKIIWPPDARGV